MTALRSRVRNRKSNTTGFHKCVVRLRHENDFRVPSAGTQWRGSGDASLRFWHADIRLLRREPKWDICGQYWQAGRREWVDSLHVPCRFKSSGTLHRVLWSGKGKAKGKNHPRTGHESLDRKYRYSSTLSLTSALDGVGGQRRAPATLPLGKRPGTHCEQGWVRPRAGLDRCGKSRLPH